MNELHFISQEAEAHKAAASFLMCWLVRELPGIWQWMKGTLWPALVAIYPYCSVNGGVLGIIQAFLCGKGNKMHPAVATILVVMLLLLFVFCIAILVSAFQTHHIPPPPLPLNPNQKP